MRFMNISRLSDGLTGLVAAAHTPFHEDGRLAPEVVPVQAAHYARNGVGKVFITGSTGESASMTREERLRMYEAWAAAGPEHGLEVVAHVGANCLEDAKVLAAAAADWGFRAFSALAPCYFKPESLGMLLECCEEIASAAPLYHEMMLAGGAFMTKEGLIPRGGFKRKRASGNWGGKPEIRPFVGT